MELAVVWQNPEPLFRTEHTVRRIRDDQPFVVYLVTSFEKTQEFTVISGEVAGAQCRLRPRTGGENCVRLWALE